MTEGSEPERGSPAELRVGPASVPYAVIGVGIAIAGSVLLLGGLGIAGSVLTNTPHTDCALGGPGRIGWVQLDVGRLSRIGGHHTLSREGVVLAERGKERTRVCSLPRGTVVDVRDPPERGRDGTWLAIYADAVKLPR